MQAFKLLLPAACLILLCACSKKPTDYDTDIGKINENIAKLETKLPGETADNPDYKKDVLKHVYYLYLKSSLTLNFDEFKTAENAIDDALKQFGPLPELYLYRANFNFKLHRLEKAKEDLEKLPPYMIDTPQVAALKADISLQEGHYAEAEAGYKQLMGPHASWDNIARVAYYKLKTGHPDIAKQLYSQAQDKISAKEMRSYAWVELQKGLADFDYGHYEDALTHYRLADRAYSGYWSIQEHIAEVLHYMGRDDESIALYKKIIDKTHNPEFVSALYNIVKKTDPKAAPAIQQQADALFQHWIDLYPEAAFGHMIKYLLWKDSIDPRLLEFASRNHEIRPNAEAKLLLAEAYLKTNKPESAEEMINEIQQTPWRSPLIDKVSQEIQQSLKQHS